MINKLMTNKTTTNRFLLAAALLSLGLACGCAKGGGGPCVNNCPAIDVSGVSGGIPVAQAGVGLPIAVTATFKNTSQTPLNWTITGTSCGSSPTDPSNPCGYFPTQTTGTTINYQGPATVPATQAFSIVATSQSDTTLSGSLDLTIIPITTDVAPPSPDIAVGLTQQFTAVAVPDAAPQTFTWTCTASGVKCVNFKQDPSVSGLAYYTPVANEQCNNCVQITAFASVDPTGAGCSYNPKKYSCTLGTPAVVTSRVSGTYAFQFSGFDKSGKPVSVAGNFIASTDGTITGGVEDQLTSSGPRTTILITGGGYVPTSSDPNNSNNAGTLTLTNSAGVYPNQFHVVLDGSGDIQMIESDGNGSGSGIAEPSAKGKFSQGTNQTFAFGFTGVDSGGNRVGYVGLLPTDGISTVTGGFIDVNDGGSSSNSICNAAPCPVVGTYVADGSISGLWHLNLTKPVTMNFDFFVANGSSNASSPLTLYLISTDKTNPAVLGTMVLQDSKPTYNNAAFKNGSFVSALTGTGGNVALVRGTTDGSSSGTGVTGACPGSNTGSIIGNFDQNNAGTILSVSPFPSASQSTNPYTYKADSSNSGRYIFCLLGNPSANTLPIPFVLYASGANSGFLLDQSSSAVMTGTMNVQEAPKQSGGFFAASAASGTYAVANSSNSVATVAPLTMNLLLTSPGSQVFKVGGTESSGAQVTGTYKVGGSGVGAIALTAPATANYVIYATTETDFFMIEVDKGASSPILFMAQ